MFADPAATAVVCVLFAIQFVIVAVFYRSTLRAMRARVISIRRAVALAQRNPLEVLLTKITEDRDLFGAVHSVYHARAGEEVVDTDFAFSSSRLLGSTFNGRLDAAAPGVFTAIGIVGTFVGLILAFSHVDFADAGSSIQPIVSGMTTAFLNSLLGVVLSIVWTMLSRYQRHRLDVVSREFQHACEERYGRPAHGNQLLTAFEGLRQGMVDIKVEIQSMAGGMGAALGAMDQRIADLVLQNRATVTSSAQQLEAVREAVQRSSSDLLLNLAPQLEQSFKALVDAPFEQLTTAVDRFRVILSDTAQAQGNALVALNDSTRALGQAQEGLSSSITAAKACVLSFTETGATFEAHLSAAASMVDDSRQSHQEMRTILDSLRGAAETQERLSAAIQGTAGSLSTVSTALDAAAGEFRASTDRLDAAVQKISEVGPQTAQASIAVLRQELDRAMSDMAQSLQRFAEQSASAYERSTSRVIASVDDKMTDLTDRLSAELGTLAKQLPESASEITTSVRDMRRQLKVAVDGLERTVSRVDTVTTDSLAARLKLYDELVAQAVDHFSGTLSSWDSRIEQLSSAATSVQSALESMERNVLLEPAGTTGQLSSELQS